MTLIDRLIFAVPLLRTELLDNEEIDSFESSCLGQNLQCLAVHDFCVESTYANLLSN